MQFEQSKTAVAMATIAVALLMAIVPMADMVDGADATYDKDYGTFYSYTLQFVFDGSDAESIIWDFGDGSPTSTEWNPSHTYAAKGEYIVTQTTTNSYNGGSTTVEKYRVVIAGFPVLSFESNGGSSVLAIEQTAYNVVATKPVDPTREGYTFAGWFTDSGLTAAMDWSAPVIRSMTLYAKWVEDPVDPPVIDPVVKHTVSFDVVGGSVSMTDVEMESGRYALPAYSGVKDGFTFGGWSINGAVHQVGTQIDISGDVTLTAVWNPVPAEGKHIITFDVVGGSQSMSPRQVDVGEFTLPAYSGSKDGHTFGGWSIDGTAYQPGQSIIVDGDITVTAVWTPVQTPDQPDEPKDDTEDSNNDWIYLVIAILALIAIACVLYRYYGRRF